MERPPALFMPYPLDEYLDGLRGDYGKIVRRMLRAARWERGTVDGFELDAGEALIDERSEKLWGGLRLDRDVSAAGRRALVRRVLERLEQDGIIARRAAQASGPRNGPRNGPSPTVVRFLKFRRILWPASAGPAQETAQGSARANGPILPGDPPDPPGSSSPAPAAPARAAARRKAKGGEPDPRHRPLQQRLEAAFLEVRGCAYGFMPRDAKAITDLLRFSSGDLDEVERRWRVGLSESGFRRCDTLHELAVGKWNAYVAPRASGGRPKPWRGDLGVEHGAEWWRGLSSAEREHFLDERKALDPELDGAPFPALGVAATRQVEELIARYRGHLEPGRAAAAGGAR